MALFWLIIALFGLACICRDCSRFFEWLEDKAGEEQYDDDEDLEDHERDDSPCYDRRFSGTDQPKTLPFK